MSMSFDIFVVTYRVTNVFQNLLTCCYFLRKKKKQRISIFLISPFLAVASTGTANVADKKSHKPKHLNGNRLQLRGDVWGLIHTWRKHENLQICGQFLWFCLHPVWTLPFATAGSICVYTMFAHRVASPRFQCGLGLRSTDGIVPELYSQGKTSFLTFVRQPIRKASKTEHRPRWEEGIQKGKKCHSLCKCIGPLKRKSKNLSTELYGKFRRIEATSAKEGKATQKNWWHSKYFRNEL